MIEKVQESGIEKYYIEGELLWTLQLLVLSQEMNTWLFQTHCPMFNIAARADFVYVLIIGYLTR